MRFGYDAAGRLASETRSGTGAYLASYGYDRNGNRTRMTKRSLASVVNVIDFNDPAPPPELVLPATAGQWELVHDDLENPTDGELVGSGTGEARVGLTLGPDDARCYEVTVLPEPDRGAAGISLSCDEGRLLVGVDVAGPHRRLVAILVDHEGNAREVAASVPMAYGGGEMTLRVVALAGETDLVTATLSEEDDEGEGLAQDISLQCAGAASGALSLEVRAADGVSAAEARFDDFAWMETSSVTDSLAYSHDNMNRLTAITGQKAGEPYEESFGYDSNGLLEVRARTEFDAGGAPVGFSPTNFSYDRLNRLTTVSTPTSLSTYAYAGPSWMRTSATVGGVQTSYTYDGFACVRQKTGTTETQYACPGGMPLWETTDGTTASYGTDWFGSVTARVGPGGVGSESIYDAFGNPTVTAGTLPTTHASAVGYRGQLVDHATSQVYLRNRFYSPDIGRFTRSDPARAGHAYAYSGNDPVNNWDPMGLEWVIAMRVADVGADKLFVKWVPLEGEPISAPGAPPTLTAAERKWACNWLKGFAAENPEYNLEVTVPLEGVQLEMRAEAWLARAETRLAEPMTQIRYSPSLMGDLPGVYSGEVLTKPEWESVEATYMQETTAIAKELAALQEAEWQEFQSWLKTTPEGQMWLEENWWLDFGTPEERANEFFRRWATSISEANQKRLQASKELFVDEVKGWAMGKGLQFVARGYRAYRSARAAARFSDEAIAAARAGGRAARGLARIGRKPIYSYKLAQRLTAGRGGKVAAHHILETRHLKRWGYRVREAATAPAVVLGRQQHNRISAALRAALPQRAPGRTGVYTKQYVWSQYQRAYREVFTDEAADEMLSAIAHYFE